MPERLLDVLRQCCGSLPDHRRGSNTQFVMADFALAAFSVFFMQSPSFLQHRRQLAEGQGRSNCETLFGMTKIPGDSQVRAMLDPVSPDHFHPAFAGALEHLRHSGGLSGFTCLGRHVLIALDGTEYQRCAKVHCPQCSSRTRAHGGTEYFHISAGRDAGGARPPARPAVAAGVRGAAGRVQQAGLRKPGGAALAGEARR